MPRGIGNGDALSADDIPAADAERLWARVTVTRGCWWLRTRTESRFTCVSVAGRYVQARKVAYALVQGPIPAGAVLRQTCDAPENRCCVNPSHISLETPASINWLGKGRLGPDAAREIRARVGTETYAEMAARYGVTRETIKRIARNRSYRDDGFVPRPTVLPPSPPKPRKLTPRQTTAARRARAAGTTVRDLARRYGVAYSTMWYTLNGPRVRAPRG